MRSQGESSHPSASHGERLPTKPALPAPWSLGPSSLQDCAHVNVCCVSHPACGTSSRQLSRLKQTGVLVGLQRNTPSPIADSRGPESLPGFRGERGALASLPQTAVNSRLLLLLASRGRPSGDEGQDGHHHPKCQCPFLTRLSCLAPPRGHVAFPGNK